MGLRESQREGGDLVLASAAERVLVHNLANSAVHSGCSASATTLDFNSPPVLKQLLVVRLGVRLVLVDVVQLLPPHGISACSLHFRLLLKKLVRKTREMYRPAPQIAPK